MCQIHSHVILIYQTKPNKITHLACPITATSQFQDSPPHIRDSIMALLTSGESSRLKGTTYQTHEEQARNRKRWILFLEQIGISDETFLKHFDKPWCRTLLISTFAQAMREDSFSTQSFSSLSEGTVRTAVDHVAQTFRSSNRPDPRNDDGGCLYYILQ